ncbi:MAG: V-type ATP synthase subunit E [Mobilitalea sp.]
MNLDEKLDHFYNSIIETATQKNIEIVEDYKKILQSNYDERKEVALRKAEANYQIASDDIVRERNKKLSAESLEIRRKVLVKTAEVSDRIFSDVAEKLGAYMKTPEYDELLCTQIKNTLEFAQGDEIMIYLNPSDADKKSALEEKTGAVLTVSNRDFIGGTRAVISSRSILIDNSFLTRINEAKSSFTL